MKILFLNCRRHQLRQCLTLNRLHHHHQNQNYYRHPTHRQQQQDNWRQVELSRLLASNPTPNSKP
jgi:hypothetical protein